MIEHKVIAKVTPAKALQFSICTIANNLQEYQEMKDSFELCGFNAGCEYLLADNSNENVFNAYKAIRRFLSEATAEYVLIVHQDVRCLDKKEHLERCLINLSQMDPNWAVCGNAGAVGYHQNIMYIDNDGVVLKSRNLPAKVTSLDENFLLIRASSQLTASNNFADFHLYGTDLCLVADFLGFSCYVIPFMVKHFSHGNRRELLKHVGGFVDSYGQKLRSRYIQTTCTKFYLSSSHNKNKIYNTPVVFFLIKFIQRIRYNLKILKNGMPHKVDKTYYSK